MAGPEVLNHDVGADEQLADADEVFGSLEICRIRLLVAIDGVKERGVAVEREIGDIELAAEIARTGALDLDDASAKVGHTQAGGGAGEELREVDNEQTGEGLHASFLCAWSRAEFILSRTSDSGPP